MPERTRQRETNEGPLYLPSTINKSWKDNEIKKR